MRGIIADQRVVGITVNRQQRTLALTATTARADIPVLWDTAWILPLADEATVNAYLEKRSKQGFVMPLSEWMTGRLSAQIDSHLLGGGLERRGLFAAGALQRLVADHRSGRRRHAGRLWALLILERWFRRYAPDWRMAA